MTAEMDKAVKEAQKAATDEMKKSVRTVSPLPRALFPFRRQLADYPIRLPSPGQGAGRVQRRRPPERLQQIGASFPFSITRLTLQAIADGPCHPQLAGEVKTLMKEVGDLREAKRALQQYVARSASSRRKDNTDFGFLFAANSPTCCSSRRDMVPETE